MKILLLNSPIWKVVGFRSSYNPPMGILILAELLRRTGNEVRVIDAEAFGYWHEDIIKIIKEYNPTHVGIGTLITALGSTIELTKLIKSTFPSLWVALGGAGPSSVPEYTLKMSGADSVTIGEVEHVFMDSFTKQGLIYSKPVNDLDVVPILAYDLLEPAPGPPYYSGNIPAPKTVKGVKEVAVMWSRGCPHPCIFCCKASIKKGKTRMRSINNIISELDFLHEKMGVNSVYVYDDELIGMSNEHNKWLFCLFSEIKKWNYSDNRTEPKIWFKGQGRCNKEVVTDEVVSAMVGAGFFSLGVGCESGSEKIKKVLKKNITNEDIVHTLKVLHKHGIDTYTYWMIGSPEETDDDARETEQLILEVAKYAKYIQVTIFTPIPGSEVWNTAIKEGWVYPELSEDERITRTIETLFATFQGRPIMDTPWLSKNMVMKWNNKLIDAFRYGRKQDAEV